MRHLLRLVAEHEAAHTIVAAHYGRNLRRVWITAQRGATEYDVYGTENSGENAAITAAGDIWNREFGTVPYVDYACDDLKRFEQEHGLHQLWHANAAARAILRTQRELVMDFADLLERERAVRFDSDQLVA